VTAPVTLLQEIVAELLVWLITLGVLMVAEEEMILIVFLIWGADQKAHPVWLQAAALTVTAAPFFKL
jgi:hypothetical protein